MKSFNLPLYALIFAVAISLFAPLAHADSYTIYNLGLGETTNVYGITSSGTVVTYNTVSGCTSHDSACYYTYTNGVLADTSATPPSFTFDDGTACSIPAGFDLDDAIGAVCNGAYTAVSTDHHIYIGTGSDFITLSTGIVGYEMMLNSSGDLAWNDGIYEDNLEAVPATVPEPGSLVLVGSGALTLFGALRKRIS